MYDEFVLFSRKNNATERTHAVVNTGNKMLTGSSAVSVKVNAIIQGSVR